MVENICGQAFTYAREVEEDRSKELVKLGQKGAIGNSSATATIEQNFSHRMPVLILLI
jgi:hypothetical protein